MSEGHHAPRKVRIACKRCRTKRIKCDGNFPACGNCTKVGEPCVDVDGRNNTVSIPRDLAANARTRIEWLEDQLLRLDPGFNLDDGPRVDFGFMAGVENLSERPTTNFAEARAIVGSVDALDPTNSSIAAAESGAIPTWRKRPFTSTSEASGEPRFADEARSVAYDLGLLSLTSDSRQTHYLGSSSGRLFTSLIGFTSSPSASPSSSEQAGPSVKPRFLAHAKKIKESYQAANDLLRKNLPCKEDASALLDAYFQHVHIDHPFLHPLSLINALHALYACTDSGKDTAIGYNGWPEPEAPFPYNGEFDQFRGSNATAISTFTAIFHIFMVMTLGATVRLRGRMFDFAPNQFYRVAMAVAPDCFSSTSLATLQSTLLITVHGLLAPAIGNIWMLTHICMAHCIDIGLHRVPNADPALSVTALTARKLVFHSVYHLDRSISTIQGRPLGIRDEAIDVPLPSTEEIRMHSSLHLENDSDLLLESSVENLMAFSLHRLQLDPIISEIKMRFYHLNARSDAFTWPTDAKDAQNDIRGRLDRWRDEISALPQLIDEDVATDLVEPDLVERQELELKLRSNYFAAMILLYQPSQAVPQPSEDALLLCYNCAASQLKLFSHLHELDSLQQTWRSVHGVFSAGATMIYCLWTSDNVRRSTPRPEWESLLRTCTNLLAVGGEWWPSVKRGRESFSRAVDALLRKSYPTSPGNMSRTLGNTDRDCHHPPRRILPAHARAQMHSDAAQLAEFPLEPTAAMIESHAVEPIQIDSGDFQDASLNMTDATWVDQQQFQSVPLADSQTDANFPIESIPGQPSFRYVIPFTSASDTNDPTIDAFITEFLNSDTAWNPF